MATIQEIEAVQRETAEAEARALDEIHEHLRGQLVNLPATSRLAQQLKQCVDLFSRAADWKGEHANNLISMRLFSTALDALDDARADALATRTADGEAGGLDG